MHESRYGTTNRIPFKTNVDVVFCVDGTVSMEAHLDRIKEIMKSWEADMSAAVRDRRSLQCRAKLILFRDYMADGENAMLVTDFFTRPQQKEKFEACVDSITASGGGDIPEDGLEALAFAIKSNWIQGQDRKRHVIILFTDAAAHMLGHNCQAAFYPKGMAKDLSELSEWWDGMNQYSKILILFAPNETEYSYISQCWDRVLHYPSLAGEGVQEREYQDILKIIVEGG